MASTSSDGSHVMRLTTYSHCQFDGDFSRQRRIFSGSVSRGHGPASTKRISSIHPETPIFA